MIVPDKACRRRKLLMHLLIECSDFIAKIKENHEKTIRISKKNQPAAGKIIPYMY